MSETIGPSLAFYLENAVDMDALAASMKPEGVSHNGWIQVRKVISKAQTQARDLLTGPARNGLFSAATRAGMTAWPDSSGITVERHWAYWIAVAANKEIDAQLSLGVVIDWQPDNKPWLGLALDFYTRRGSSRKRAARVLQKHKISFRDTTGWAGWNGQLLVGNKALDASTLLSDYESWVATTAHPFLTQLWPELTGQVG